MPASSAPKAVFNPPAGWPAIPQGWEPPAGWQPDPSWPPAPKGHRFWINPETGKPVLGPTGAYGSPGKSRRVAGCGCMSVIGLLVMGSCISAFSGGGDSTPGPSPTTSARTSASSPVATSTPAPTTPATTMTTTITPTVTATPSPTPTPVKTTPAPAPTTSHAPAPAAPRTSTPAPVPLKQPARTTTPAAPPAPKPANPPADSGTVHGGAFCADAGATGTSDRGGRTLVCKADKSGKLRWMRP